MDIHSLKIVAEVSYDVVRGVVNGAIDTRRVSMTVEAIRHSDNGIVYRFHFTEHVNMREVSGYCRYSAKTIQRLIDHHHWLDMEIKAPYTKINIGDISI